MIAAMTELAVQIVTLPPMRVAAVRAVGEAPEIDAWRRLRAWAGPQGLLFDSEENPIFGFATPGPNSDRHSRGYEYWIGVNESITPSDGVEIKHFEGGLYAVAQTSLANATGAWRDLGEWAQASGYRGRRSHELEQVVNSRSAEDHVFLKLYLPIQMKYSVAHVLRDETRDSRYSRW